MSITSFLKKAYTFPGTERNPVKQFQQLAVAVATVRLGMSRLSGITKRQFWPYFGNSEGHRVREREPWLAEQAAKCSCAQLLHYL